MNCEATWMDKRLIMLIAHSQSKWQFADFDDNEYSGIDDDDDWIEYRNPILKWLVSRKR